MIYGLRLVLLSCITLALPMPVLGQICQGAPGLRDRSPRLSGEAGLGAGATRLEAGVTASRGSLFGGAAVGRYASHGLDVFVVAGIGRAGVERAVTPRFAVCPSVEFSYGRYGGDHFDGTTLVQWAGGAGVSAGLVAFERPSLRVIPTVGLKVVTARYTGSAVGTYAREGVTFGLAQLGVGFVHNRVGVVSAISVPIGLNLRDTAFVIAVSAAVFR